MKKSLKKKLENVVANFLFDLNTAENRKKIVNELYEVLKIEFEDLTSIELVDKQIVYFRGYDKKTKKVIDLFVEPTLKICDIGDYTINNK
jgi:uncharacterized protein YfbU (UPF0304 family)